MSYGTVTISKVEYEIIEEVGEWDYDWQIGALLRDANGDLFFAVDSGCSCVGYGDGLEQEDLRKVANKAEAVELAKECFTESEVYEFAKRLLF